MSLTSWNVGTRRLAAPALAHLPSYVPSCGVALAEGWMEEPVAQAGCTLFCNPLP